jgi:hypothetical protein
MRREIPPSTPHVKGGEVISRVHQKLGTAGFVISIVALVAALCGGAYAAGGGLTGKQKKEVTKIAKKYAGKPGAAGAPGAPGANGTNGAAGETGAAGTNGTNGTNGSPGAAGKSVVATPIATGEPTLCNEMGGVEYEVEDSGAPTEICNGKEGEPWAVGGLPKGATETGAWAFTASAAQEGVFAPISFTVPLKEAIESASKVHYVTGPTTECPGTLLNPKAIEGNLCVYQGEMEGATFESITNLEYGTFGRASVAGALVHFGSLSDGAYGFGSWAVTGS